MKPGRKASALRLFLNRQTGNDGGFRKFVWIAAILTLTAAIGALHHFSGRELNFFVLFLVPTIAAAWVLNLPSGIAIALVSALIGFSSDSTLRPDIATSIDAINAFTRFTVFSFVAWGIWKIRSLSHILASLALTDTLTGLNNRRAFMLCGADEMERARRYGHPISVMFIDLDNFKSINDTLGHDEGDELLKLLANTLQERLRKTDFGARMGGDEFAAILPATGSDGSRELAEDLRSALNTAFQVRNYPVSVSIGIATFLRPPDTFDHALSHADALMYEVKKSTKNAVLQREWAS